MGLRTRRDWREIPNVRALDNIRSRKSYAIQSQYAASRRIAALCAGYQRRIDPHRDVDLFYANVFDIMTAAGWGLDNWGRILGIGRNIPTLDKTGVITLADENYRLLLLYKAMANISPSTAKGQNDLLAFLVNTGVAAFPKAYVLHTDTMVIRWVFEDYLDDTQLAIFAAAGTLARGAGVGWELYAINPKVFGFTDGWQPFNQAPFAPDNVTVIIGEP
jgi:hypothetical protein